MEKSRVNKKPRYGVRQFSMFQRRHPDEVGRIPSDKNALRFERRRGDEQVRILAWVISVSVSSSAASMPLFGRTGQVCPRQYRFLQFGDFNVGQSIVNIAPSGQLTGDRLRRTGRFGILRIKADNLDHKSLIVAERLTDDVLDGLSITVIDVTNVADNMLHAVILAHWPNRNKFGP